LKFPLCALELLLGLVQRHKMRYVGAAHLHGRVCRWCSFLETIST
jgi:hypothetical protein